MMRKLAILSTLTLLVHSVPMAQPPALGQSVQRVMWTPSPNCRLANIGPNDPIRQSVSCDSYIRDDATIQIIQTDQLAITLVFGDDGDYIIADAFVMNKTDGRLLVDPYQSMLFAWKTPDVTKVPERFQPVSGQEIAAKLRRKAKWRNFWGGLLASFATNTTTVSSTGSGNFSIGGLAGSYSGASTTTIATPDILARVQHQIRARERTADAAAKGDYYVSSAMKANTLFAKESTDGIIYFKRKKAPVAVFSIRINDILFDFPSPNPTASPDRFRSHRVELIPVPDADYMRGVEKRGSTIAPSKSKVPSVVAETRKNGIGMEFVAISPGTLTMGSDAGESDEMPIRTISMSKGFWIGRYEVTQAQYERVVGINPSRFTGCGDCPVEQVSWTDAMEFVKKLNALDDGFAYNLPTEAEWEYAARAGTTEPYAGPVDEVAWHSYNSGGKTHVVGQKNPNQFGLYDMHGNVWEWCQDIYLPYPGAAPDTTARSSTNELRVLRGGSWSHQPYFARSSYRGKNPSTVRDYVTGFRVVARVR